ncbi:MAG TPA: exodeoxyribonuclease III [Phycisphaerae bacterium]|nr:exodeoxyribonuclease III [Phycisphaerae bacterium]
MLIATFNCNSIRQRLEAVLKWLAEHKPDALALQETKCRDEQFPAEAIREAGWHVAFRGEKSYNGVAVITRDEPDEVSFGLGDDDGASQTRFAHVRLGGVHLLNAYAPQGRQIGAEPFVFKLEWFVRLREYLGRHFDPARSKVVLVGDLNIAPTPADVYDSKAVWPHVCHCQQVVDAYEGLIDWGLVDVFRKHIPGEGAFTFWDYRMPRAVERNTGWRLDHVLATGPLAQTSTDCFVDLAPRTADKPSDHTFVAATFR